jgi:hypothetical protein
MNAPENPFRIGDEVVFSPTAHDVGWSWPTFKRLLIKPGDSGIVTEIAGDIIYIDDGRGGIHWRAFKRAT